MKKHVITQKTWTLEEDQTLMMAYKVKIPLKSIAKGMGRTHLAINTHINDMREAGTWTEGRMRAPRKSRTIDPVLTDVAQKMIDEPVLKQQEIELDASPFNSPEGFNMPLADRDMNRMNLIFNDILLELKKINIWLRSDSDLPERVQ